MAILFKGYFIRFNLPPLTILKKETSTQEVKRKSTSVKNSSNTSVSVMSERQSYPLKLDKYFTYSSVLRSTIFQHPEKLLVQKIYLCSIYPNHLFHSTHCHLS